MHDAVRLLSLRLLFKIIIYDFLTITLITDSQQLYTVLDINLKAFDICDSPSLSALLPIMHAWADPEG